MSSADCNVMILLAFEDEVVELAMFGYCEDNMLR